MNERILIVDDEPSAAALVAYHLARQSYAVQTVGNGSEALRAVQGQCPDLAVLDLALPDMSGRQVLRELRSGYHTEHLPVIILTAQNDLEEKLQCLGAGADDYMTKPFSPEELVLRVEAVLRRARQAAHAHRGKERRVGPLLLDVDDARAELDGRDLGLTHTELRLLEALADQPGRVQSRRTLLQIVWGAGATVAPRTVDMHVQRLRRKFGEQHAGWITTVRGAGYRLQAEWPALS